VYEVSSRLVMKKGGEKEAASSVELKQKKDGVYQKEYGIKTRRNRKQQKEEGKHDPKKKKRSEKRRL